jgi:undecaprenyl-diphosphatase
MIEGLKELDTQLVLFFNHLNNPLLDFIFYWLSDKLIWIPFYVLLAWYVYKREKSYFFILLIFIAAAVTVSDQLSSSLIKPYVMRLRPCHDPDISALIHLVNNYCGGKYGFVSSHASNVFTLVALLSPLLKESWIVWVRILWIWACLVSLSRVYLGVHFPGDILGGAILGFFTGYCFEKVYSVFKIKFPKVLKD